VSVTGEAMVGRHERRYLRRLSALFVLFPRDERRGLLATARQNLEDRPPARSWAELTLQLGTPEDYARQLVHDDRDLPQPALWRRVVARFPSPRLAVLALVVVVAVAGGALAYRDWYTHRPELSDSCFAVVQADEVVPIEDSQAMGHREQRVTHVDGAELVISVCPGSTETVEILDIDIPFFDGAWAVELLDVTMSPEWSVDGEPLALVPFSRYTLHGPSELAPGQHVNYRYRLGSCAEVLGPGSIGSHLTVQRPRVTYRFRGRTHTVELDPPNRIYLSVDREDCPGAVPLPESGAADGEDGQ
jgi:hypothetical protein